jgi:hypothetical protein
VCMLRLRAQNQALDDKEDADHNQVTDKERD